MLTRIVFVAALIAVALVVVSQQKVLQNAGGWQNRFLVRVPLREGHRHPGLPLASCKRISHELDRDVWRCPTELEHRQAIEAPTRIELVCEALQASA